ncbi:MAG: hypothetical protein R3Y51_01060 [Rikenellaceae bacterium]
MSYTRRYSRTVSQSYSKSVTVSYPASESGGSKTATVSGTVEIPINIEIYVDTHNFDNSVSNCRSSVTGLDAAVVATTYEEIKAKERATKQISSSIINGFFGYITSQLSQLKSELSAKCESLIITLLEQKKACEGKQLQMQGDYERISSQYNKLFTDLDNELSTRIKTIDKPLFNFNKEILGCSSRTVDTSLLTTSTIVAAENARLDAIIAASLIKNRACQLIGKTKDFLRRTYVLQNSIKHMLSDGSEAETYMVPVIYAETNENDNSFRRTTYGTSALPFGSNSNIEAELSTRFQNSSLEWKEADSSEYSKVDSYFSNELNSAQLDSRVAKMVLELKMRNKFNVVKNV